MGDAYPSSYNYSLILGKKQHAEPFFRRTGLGYELYIGKALSMDLTVVCVEILTDGPAGAVVKVYEGSELLKCMTITKQNVLGNCVVLDIGSGRFAA